MVSAAQRDRELVADFASEGPTLRKAQMMGIARLTPADQAGLLSDEPHMVAITNTPPFGMCQHGLVDRR